MHERVSKMQYLFVSFVVVSFASVLQSLSYDPDDYLEVYPDPRDPEVLKERTPLYFGLIQSLGGPLSQFDASGSVAGVKIALDRINNDSSLLPGYSLHYTFADSKVIDASIIIIDNRWVITSFILTQQTVNHALFNVIKYCAQRKPAILCRYADTFSKTVLIRFVHHATRTPCVSSQEILDTHTEGWLCMLPNNQVWCVYRTIVV